ncbi:MAG: DNA helicase II [Zetaproteobacteria bacterium CG12_big_fil_rev_8_21_14_0_65_54_13]|nr:MAG: DNA helicase II [Zetaproteobacteria bacterium CG12_big_fil_rev_8_21_14_0_65_54_13]PIX53659.1 MAG: DNA helicase II [Zetaproteobacteria bacterium CG_4_10_14_3_um_filter_54_28]PJA27883.1 MAG: DNA helicase II [Zetaproteobacteria bacterium CG_4_9_14_3_um_filter_54_145]
MADLNSAQQAAAEAGNGPQLILAGAGSGKTRTIVHRIGHLISHRGIAPHRILAVTFTNKAAAELKARLSQLIGDDGGGVVSGTFHAISLRLLRRYAEALGYPRSFQVIDADDQKALVKRILKQANIASDRLHPSYLRGWIEHCKHAGQTAEQAPACDWNGVDLRGLYHTYQQQLREHERMDFSDLILNCVVLMREHAGIAEALQRSFDHVLVDEYQDTNPVQHEWLTLLCTGHRNLTVVGDDDQSIYGWRGADIRHILEFERIWSGAGTHRLEENYRSTAAILDLANAVICKNEDRHDKCLRPTQEQGVPPQWKVCNDEYDEARKIAVQLNAWCDMGYAWQEMAILYRSNRQSLALEQILRESSLPYRIVGGVGFFERLEIKDALAYWALLNRCGDGLQLLRICNRPKRGIGTKGQEQLAALLSASGLRAHEWLDVVADGKAGGAAGKLVPIARLIVSLRDEIGNMPDRGLMELLERSGYLQSLQAMGEIEAAGRIDNLHTLQRYIELTMEQELTPVEFMDRAALLQSGEEDSRDNENTVTLMSLHRAKGLEFDCVILPGVEEGLLPHQRSLDDGEAGIAEERRLLYVGITRARRQLLLTTARLRRLFGETHYPLPSRFIKDMSPAILQHDMPTPQPMQDESEAGMGIGSSVCHPSFGEGVITDFEGAGDAIRVTVQFRKAGIKRLMLKYAALQAV